MNLETAVAILRDWKEEHAGEHDTLWNKIDQNTVEHTNFVRAIERIETKMAIYTAVGVGIGSLLGSVASAAILRLVSR